MRPPSRTYQVSTRFARYTHTSFGRFGFCKTMRRHPLTSAIFSRNPLAATRLLGFWLLMHETLVSNLNPALKKFLFFRICLHVSSQKITRLLPNCTCPLVGRCITFICCSLFRRSAKKNKRLAFSVLLPVQSDKAFASRSTAAKVPIHRHRKQPFNDPVHYSY